MQSRSTFWLLHTALCAAVLLLAACGGSSGATGSAPSGGGAAAGALELAAASYTVSQSAGELMVTVTRTNGSSGAASVQYATSDGTAKAGVNYTAARGTLSWSAGDASAKTLQIALSSAAFTGSASFNVALSSASGATLGSPSAATVTINGSGAGAAGSGLAAKLATKLGLPARLLVGLGAQGSADAIQAMQSQGIRPDIYERYLGAGDWTSWNSPAGAYVGVVAAAADSVGAVPMFTLYQMANNGDGNLSGLSDSTFMATYWSRARLMYQQIALYNKPTLVNLEPDFWGYAEQQSTGGDPTKLFAFVSSNADCAGLANNVVGVAQCLIVMAHKYAPKAYVGFPPSDWGANGNIAQVVTFMNTLGAQNADFIVMQTLDRDAGCFETENTTYACSRNGTATGWYWDESNKTSPNFQQHLAKVQTYHAGIGGLPVIWWQTPMGVPADTAGGTSGHFRDNRVHYFLSNPGQLTAVGGLAVVFSTGENHQTSIATDGGQFQALHASYLAAPAMLP